MLSGLIILSIAAVFLVYFFGGEYIRNYLSKSKLSDLPDIAPGSRVLIIAPHCDDETLGPGELISRMVKKGVNFKIVLMTNGDGFTDAIDITYREIHPTGRDSVRFGYLRQGETKDAMGHIGIPGDDIIFLGYPDGGLYSMWSQYHWSTPYQSPHTLYSKSPYENSYTPGAAYTGESVVRDLKSIISSYKPQYIFFPHPNDRHPDHLASSCFTKYVLNQLNLNIRQYVYLVHRGDWPIISKNEGNLYLVPPPALLNNASYWYGFDLSTAEVNEKKDSINRYKSQVRVMGPRLRAFARKNELFAGYRDGTISTGNTSSNYKNHLLISDPTFDVFFSAVQGGGDLRALYGYMDESKNLKLFLEARKNIEEKIHYTMDIIMYDNASEIRRITVTSRDGKISGSLMENGKSQSINDYAINSSGKVLQITIPSKYTGGVTRIFMGSSTGIYGIRLDNMAWRMYNIK